MKPEKVAEIQVLTAYLSALADVESNGKAYVNREIRATIDQIEKIKMGMDGMSDGNGNV